MSAKSLDTPPSSDVESAARLPPSPPVSLKKKKGKSFTTVDRLLGTHRLAKAGTLRPHADLLSWDLTRDEYSEFQLRLKGDKCLHPWVQDKVKYDWEPPESTEAGSKGRLVVRMPSKIHEFFISDLVDGLVGKIRDAADELKKLGESGEDGKEAAGELRKVWRGGSVTIEMHAPSLENSSQESAAEGQRIVKRSPDATFYHPASPALPQLVMEVSYSQQGKQDLPRIAESYIVDSQHSIQCVIGIDIPYQQPKRKGTDKATSTDRQATVSIWRPGVEEDQDGSEVGVCKTDVDAVPFRDSNGTVCEGTLTLTLADLLPQTVLSGLSSETVQHTIDLSFSDLTRWLQTAEHNAAPSSAPTQPTAPKKFRKRKRTPSEDLSEGREAGFEKQEDEAEGMTENADEEWRVGRWKVGEDDVAEVVERRRSTRRRVSGRSVGAGS